MRQRTTRLALAAAGSLLTVCGWLMAHPSAAMPRQEPGLQKDLNKEAYFVDTDFARLRPDVVAVVPMVNMTGDQETAAELQSQVYTRLTAAGYRKIDAAVVQRVMQKLGIQTPEMLSGVSYKRLGKELNCDAVIQGQVNQSGTEQKVVLSSVVVSASLQMVHCPTGKTLWKCEQFRVAHRQFQLDPFNLLMNLVSHEQASRPERVAYLAQEMFRTLPPGPVQVNVGDDLLARATQVTAVAQEQEPAQAPRNPDELFGFVVGFPRGEARLAQDAELVLETIILPSLGRLGVIDLVVTGYTSADEPEAAQLGGARAGACAAWLRAHGIPDGVRILTRNGGVPPAGSSEGGRVELSARRRQSIRPRPMGA